MSSPRRCLYSGISGKYVTLKKGEDITTAMDLVQEFTTKSVLDDRYDDNNGDYSRSLPETTRLFTVIIATSTVAFFLIVAIAVACAFQKKKQKLMRTQSITTDAEAVTDEKTDKTQQVCVQCDDKDTEKVTCCDLLCCISESTKQADREEHIYSEVDAIPTSITIVPEMTEGIYDTIDGKDWRMSGIETKKIQLKPLQLYPDPLQPLQLNPDGLQDQVIYSHLTATKPHTEPTTDVSDIVDSNDGVTRSQTAEKLKGVSSDYDHLDYSPKTPPSQVFSVYTFEDSAHNSSRQHSPNTHSPLFVVKDETSSEQPENVSHNYFVLETQQELTSRQNSNSSTEVVVLSQSPISQGGRVFRFPSQQLTSHEYFVVEPSSVQETTVRPPLPPRNQSFRTSVHGDRYISNANDLGTNSRFFEDRSKERDKLFDRSFSFDSSLVAEATDKRLSNEITIIHKPINPILVEPEVVPIRTAKSPKDKWFTPEPQTNHVTTFGACNGIHPNSAGDNQTKFTCNGVRRSSAGEKQTTLTGTQNIDSRVSDTNEHFTVELRAHQLRNAYKTDIRRPLSFSSNEYIRRALRPKPFFQKFQHYDSASLVHKELLGIVNGYVLDKTRSSSDSNCETTSLKL